MMISPRASYLLLIVTVLVSMSSSGGLNATNSFVHAQEFDEGIDPGMVGALDSIREVNVTQALQAVGDATEGTDTFDGEATDLAIAADMAGSLLRTSRVKSSGKGTNKGENKDRVKRDKSGNKKNKQKKTQRNKGTKRGGSNEEKDWRTTGITFYGQTPEDDNGVGLTGVDLFKHGRARIRFKGQVVYPAAVFQGDAAKYLYKVLEVTSNDFKKSKSVLVHIVDACNSGQSICRKNVKRYGNFLIDVHETATNAIGIDDGLLKGSFRVVGELRPSSLPSKVWRNDVVLCGCKASCRGSGEMDWRRSGDCVI